MFQSRLIRGWINSAYFSIHCTKFPRHFTLIDATAQWQSKPFCQGLGGVRIVCCILLLLLLLLFVAGAKKSRLALSIRAYQQWRNAQPSKLCSVLNDGGLSSKSGQLTDWRNWQLDRWIYWRSGALVAWMFVSFVCFCVRVSLNCVLLFPNTHTYIC